MLQSSIQIAFLLGALAVGSSDEPLRVLLLDYNEPMEHDVLQSHLCVDACNRANGCPEELIRDGVDYFSDRFIVYRPGYLGRSARFIVDAYKNRRIDLLSFSGHHASGFTGDLGRGRFDTEKLASHLGGSSGVTRFFTQPTMVLLQGCRTDVKSSFDGDPVEYVLHVIEETRVREDEFERLLAAVQQIGGVQQAYRDLFPNACLLGYRGTQAPGGRFEIYGQVNSLLRRIAEQPERIGAGPAEEVRLPTKFDMSETRRGQGGFAEINRLIQQECPNGWPCNLCEKDPDYYEPLAGNLAALLRRERERVHGAGRVHTRLEVAQLEGALEDASFYHNTRWSCSLHPPKTAPVWPDPVDESPFGRLFIRLLWLDMEELDPFQRRLFRAELVHRLGRIAFAEINQIELRAWLHAPANWQQLTEFLEGPLLSLSTFRQQDFCAFLANIACDDCLSLVFDRAMPSLLRENAAGKLRAGLGAKLYLKALDDETPRVRRAAAARLDPEVGWEVLLKAVNHADPEISGPASEKFGPILENLLNLPVVP